MKFAFGDFNHIARLGRDQALLQTFLEIVRGRLAATGE
jgi:hypothetical protein